MAALAKLKPELRYLLLHSTADDGDPSGNANRLRNLAVDRKRPGARFILEGQRHRPDAALIALVLDYILDVDTGNQGASPAGTAFVPFR